LQKLRRIDDAFAQPRVWLLFERPCEAIGRQSRRPDQQPFGFQQLSCGPALGASVRWK
jgi:hypothetical protein